MEPGGGVAPGQHVLLDAERRDVKTVDRVLGGHDHAHITADGDMQFVDLALAFFVLKFPHPLLRDRVDVGGSLWWGTFLEVNVGAPDKDAEEDASGNDRPGKFKRIGTFNVFSLMTGTATVPDREDND